MLAKRQWRGLVAEREHRAAPSPASTISANRVDPAHAEQAAALKICQQRGRLTIRSIPTVQRFMLAAELILAGRSPIRAGMHAKAGRAGCLEKAGSAAMPRKLRY